MGNSEFINEHFGLYTHHKFNFNQHNVFDISYKIIKKMEDYNIAPSETCGFAIVFEKYENFYLDGHRVLCDFFCKKLNSPKNIYADMENFNDFKSNLGDKIISNSITNKNEVIEDFEFVFDNGNFLFTSFVSPAVFSKTKNKDYVVYCIFALDERADEIILKENLTNSANIKFHTRLNETLDDIIYLKQYGDIDEVKKIYESLSEYGDDCSLVNKILRVFNYNDFTKIEFKDFNKGIREDGHINGIIKLVEHLGYGKYLEDMSDSVKEDIKKYIFKEKPHQNCAILNGLKIGKTRIFYMGSFYGYLIVMS